MDRETLELKQPTTQDDQAKFVGCYKHLLKQNLNCDT